MAKSLLAGEYTGVCWHRIEAGSYKYNAWTLDHEWRRGYGLVWILRGINMTHGVRFSTMSKATKWLDKHLSKTEE